MLTTILIKELIKQALSYESVLLLNIILINIITLIILKNYNKLIFFISITTLIMYYCSTKHLNKNILFISMIIFAFLGTFMESFIIYITNGSILEYKTPNNLNIPYWLFNMYCLFFLASNHTLITLSIIN